MKRLNWLFAAALCCMVSSARADHDSAIGISDPSYVPTRHRLMGATAVGYGKFNGELDSSGGAPDLAFDTKVNGVSQLLVYGITPRLSVGALYFHTESDTQYGFASGGGDDSAHLRSSTLVFSLNARVLDQIDQPFNLDLTAVAGAYGALSAAISRRTESFTVLARAGLNYRRSYSGFDLVRDNNITVDETWGYFATVRTQYRPVGRLGLDFSAAYYSANFSGGAASTAAPGQTTPFHVKYPDSLTFGIGASLQIVPDRLVVRVEGTYSFLGDRRDSYATPALDTVVRRSDQRAVGAALIYAF